jgi:hypothetical protein
MPKFSKGTKHYLKTSLSGSKPIIGIAISHEKALVMFFELPASFGAN